MISCTGLPLCLSGIHILPQSRKYESKVLTRSRTMESNPSSWQELRSWTENCISDRSESADDTGSLSSGPESRSAFASGDILRSDHSRRNTPRFLVAREMADLDHRREAIRHRLRPSLLSHDDTPMVRRSSSSHLMGRFLNNFLKKRFMRLEHRSDCTQKISLCAKAA